jgi:xylulose-5-phosphate/fructose-6-phosphate phosphoketolase
MTRSSHQGSSDESFPGIAPAHPADNRAGPLSPELMHGMDAYWRAANYLSVGQLYLYDNPLLKRPLELSDVKPLIVEHWGTTPGQNFTSWATRT